MYYIIQLILQLFWIFQFSKEDMIVFLDIFVKNCVTASIWAALDFPRQRLTDILGTSDARRRPVNSCDDSVCAEWP